VKDISLLAPKVSVQELVTETFKAEDSLVSLESGSTLKREISMINNTF
jgi:hypothetical protein